MRDPSPELDLTLKIGFTFSRLLCALLYRPALLMYVLRLLTLCLQTSSDAPHDF